MDLLEQLSLTIDLKRSVARLGMARPSSSEASRVEDMGKAMHSCSEEAPPIVSRTRPGHRRLDSFFCGKVTSPRSRADKLHRTRSAGEAG